MRTLNATHRSTWCAHKQPCAFLSCESGQHRQRLGELSRARPYDITLCQSVHGMRTHCSPPCSKFPALQQGQANDLNQPQGQGQPNVANHVEQRSHAAMRSQILQSYNCWLGGRSSLGNRVPGNLGVETQSREPRCRSKFLGKRTSPKKERSPSTATGSV